MSNTIITISREFGSGGRLVGEKLAQVLGIPFYDSAIIEMAAEKSGLSPSFIEQNEEHIPNSFLFNLSASALSSYKPSLQYDTPINDKTFFAQSAVVRELAAQGSCVIVGRCADYVLREEPGLVRIFVCAEAEDRKKRAVENYGLDSATIDSRLKKIDKARANYYKFYTGENWGGIHEHDLIINTSFIGVDGAVEVIRTLLKEKGFID
ncbi:MAG: cytidylate kinase-like family protein [Oscillospiraceae bacterium]|nr:cytidylate kinase-like family protein [Oscillospiraceae bacterium]